MRSLYTELWPVIFNTRQNQWSIFSEYCSSHIFPQWFKVFRTGNIVSSVQDANYGYATCQGILTKIRACEQLQKSCEHEQASTHLIFANNSSRGKILRALSIWMGPFDTRSMRALCLFLQARAAVKFFLWAASTFENTDVRAASTLENSEHLEYFELLHKFSASRNLSSTNRTLFCAETSK